MKIRQLKSGLTAAVSLDDSFGCDGFWLNTLMTASSKPQSIASQTLPCFYGPHCNLQTHIFMNRIISAGELPGALLTGTFR
jgi:hypothetical protein